MVLSLLSSSTSVASALPTVLRFLHLISQTTDKNNFQYNTGQCFSHSERSESGGLGRTELCPRAADSPERGPRGRSERSLHLALLLCSMGGMRLAAVPGRGTRCHASVWTVSPFASLACGRGLRSGVSRGALLPSLRASVELTSASVCLPGAS